LEEIKKFNDVRKFDADVPDKLKDNIETLTPE